MAMSWKLLKQLRAPYTATPTSPHRIVSPRLLNFHNANRLFSAAPPPSRDPPLIQPPGSKIQEEIAKFSAMAETWWDAGGPIKYYHRHRVDFIRNTLCHHFRRDPLSARPFEGLKFIDIGCGSGILSEPLARMGATVTGVDPIERKIKIARLHAV
ncbi:hypothetical protein M0R45_032443 [Rubus argutus]|uniref:Uncharacterized protein n=1 Tax=Rubus argutus TaxID=59490 RepID=A0AAW1WGU9_RUBAR